MKEVIAIIRPNRINATKKAMVEAGLPAFTGARCMGRGRKPVEFELLKHLEGSGENTADVLPALAQGGRLIQKRMLTIVVPDERVSAVVDVLMKANRTGQPGDGKIFVRPVIDVARIRTGETGATAIDEMKG